MPTKFTNEILAAAIEGFEAQKSRMDAKIGALRAMLSGGRAEPTVRSEAPKRKKRRLSAAGRRAIVEGTKRRWAAIRAEKEKTSQAAAPEKTARKKAAAKRAPVKKAAAKAPAKTAAKKAVAAKKKTAPAPAPEAAEASA